MSGRNSKKDGASANREARNSPPTPRKSKPAKDWKRTVGMFTNDEGMKQLFQEALKIREKDRRQARGRRNSRQNNKS
jgi:hypothetical protein